MLLQRGMFLLVENANKQVTLTRALGLAVHPRAMDFSALVRPAPLSSLVSRATAAENTKRIWMITGIIILALLVIGGIFCGVVLCLMHRTKKQRKKRTLDLAASNANHRYQPVNDIELGYAGVQELPVDYDYSGRQVELPSHAHEVPKTQQLDGYVAPPKPSAQPTELPSNTNVYRDDYR